MVVVTLPTTPPIDTPEGPPLLQLRDITKSFGSVVALDGVTLDQAWALKADLTGAKLVDTNLEDADLTRANLTGATITNTDLDGATLCGTTRTDGTTDDSDCQASTDTTAPYVWFALGGVAVLAAVSLFVLARVRARNRSAF